MQIEVSVPGILKDCTGGRSEFFLDADTLGGALVGLVEAYPSLKTELYDESERLRPQVLIFYNDRSIARLARLDMPLLPGDRLAVLQSVSDE